ncbi:F-box-like domain superfamily [Arabidopsis suecica]|uniref:F-box-like domain superfamily n=1 Tax=Arabidopsis suecica TaxID=45249 RepID=A0A8T2H9Y7_ARASU|nr:F-box-like domain superfamily [Arabidopsis suecica]
MNKTIMNRGANSDSIPTDLIYEILSRLSVKPITRFRCVSKLWESIICRQDFTELFHNRSSSNPRLLIGVIQGGEWNFFSSPQPQNHYGKSSLVVAADSHMKFSEDKRPRYYSYASGLLYFPNIRISNHNDDVVRVICNPSTGQYAILPPDLRTRYRDSGRLFRNKLGVINLEDDYDGGYLLKLRMFVLEDFEKQKWTTYVHTLRDENKIKDNDNVYVVGATASGQIVLARNKAYKPFYVFYFNPEKSTLQSVEIQGVREEEDWFHRVYYFVDHVEDLRFDVMKTTYAATSIRPAEQNTSTSSREDHLVRTVKRKRA